MKLLLLISLIAMATYSSRSMAQGGLTQCEPRDESLIDTALILASPDRGEVKVVKGAEILNEVTNASLSHSVVCGKEIVLGVPGGSGLINNYELNLGESAYRVEITTYIATGKPFELYLKKLSN